MTGALALTALVFAEVSALASPLIGTYLSNYIGLGGALWVSAGLRMSGFLLFLLAKRNKPAEPGAVPQLSNADRIEMP